MRGKALCRFAWRTPAVRQQVWLRQALTGYDQGTGADAALNIMAEIRKGPARWRYDRAESFTA
jgi:hypothetical protein